MEQLGGGLILAHYPMYLEFEGLLFFLDWNYPESDQQLGKL
jgi:hypothetical protein